MLGDQKASIRSVSVRLGPARALRIVLTSASSELTQRELAQLRVSRCAGCIPPEVFAAEHFGKLQCGEHLGRCDWGSWHSRGQRRGGAKWTEVLCRDKFGSIVWQPRCLISAGVLAVVSLLFCRSLRTKDPTGKHRYLARSFQKQVLWVV